MELQIKKRETLSKGALRRLRQQGDIPGVVYGESGSTKSTDTEVLPVLFSARELTMRMKDEGFLTQVITLQNESGSNERAVIREIQRHPWKNAILHIDFMRVDDTKKITIKVPINFTNEENCIGVKMDGGAIRHLMTDVEITCFPKDIPRFIEANIEQLRIGQSIHYSQLPLPEGVSFAFSLEDDGADLAVVSVEARKVEVETEAKAEADTEEATADGAADAAGTEEAAKGN